MLHGNTGTGMAVNLYESSDEPQDQQKVGSRN